MSEHPRLLQTVLDTPDVRGLAEFYRQLLGLRYRPGDEDLADPDWLVLVDEDGMRRLAIQEAVGMARSTWPDHAVPQQLHLDMTVPDPESLIRQRDRALSLGAAVLLDRFEDEEEPLYVFADPAGHPFCIFVAGEGEG